MLLSLDSATIIFQIINFLILAGLLYWLLFKPVMRTIRERREQREGVLRELERERQVVAERRAELDERLSRMEEEAANTIAEAREEAEEEREQLLREAQEEVEQILVEAQTDAYRVRQRAVASFQHDLVDATLDVSGMVIHKTVPDEVHGVLVRKLSDRIWELGRTDIERVETLRQSLGEREPTAHLQTAQSLNIEQQGLMARTLTALADRQVDLEVEVDESLVAGIRVRVGDIILDSSIAGQLDELRDQVLSELQEQVGNGEQSESE